MATAEREICEIDVVSLTQAVGDWPADTEGTVVADFGDVKMVEIDNARGETLDLPLVPANKLRLIAKHSE